MSSSSDAPRGLGPPLLGGGIGLVITGLSWVAALDGQGPSLQALGAIHHSPAIWWADMAPFLLGWTGWLWGRAAKRGPAGPQLPSDPDNPVLTQPAQGQIPAALARAIFQASLDGIVVSDEAQIIRMVNPAGARIFGYRPDEMIGLPITTFLPAPPVGEPEEPVELPLDGRYRSGVDFPLEAVHSALQSDGARVSVLHLRDVSERLAQEATTREVNAALERLRDQALEASRAKSTFLANMSHELRTPLNAILGYSELLEEELAELNQPHILDDLQKVHSAGRHLLTLINSILDLSKIEAGKMELFVEAVDVGRLVSEVYELTEPMAAQNDNALLVDCPPDIGAIHTDVIKLRQVLINLIGNAAKFTEAGEIHLRVDRPVQGDQIRFEVRDTGIGMGPEVVAGLFEEFQQADPSTTRRFGGTGLGLAISRRFLQLMSGEISVHSAPGEGSTFTIHLPATSENAQETRA